MDWEDLEVSSDDDFADAAGEGEGLPHDPLRQPSRASDAGELGASPRHGLQEVVPFAALDEGLRAGAGRGDARAGSAGPPGDAVAAFDADVVLEEFRSSLAAEAEVALVEEDASEKEGLVEDVRETAAFERQSLPPSGALAEERPAFVDLSNSEDGAAGERRADHGRAGGGGKGRQGRNAAEGRGARPPFPCDRVLPGPIGQLQRAWTLRQQQGPHASLAATAAGESPRGAGDDSDTDLIRALEDESDFKGQAWRRAMSALDMDASVGGRYEPALTTTIAAVTQGMPTRKVAKVRRESGSEKKKTEQKADSLPLFRTAAPATERQT